MSDVRDSDAWDRFGSFRFTLDIRNHLFWRDTPMATIHEHIQELMNLTHQVRGVSVPGAVASRAIRVWGSHFESSPTIRVRPSLERVPRAVTNHRPHETNDRISRTSPRKSRQGSSSRKGRHRIPGTSHETRPE